MGGWTRLLLSQPQIISTVQRLELPKLKAHAGDIIFEDVRKEAVLAAMLLIKVFFDQLGAKIKYRGLEKLRGRRVCFVANHQGGNLDALVLASILFTERGKVPFIPTSERLLEAKLVGQFNAYLKYLGPFFIKSSFAGDEAYINNVAAFMNAILDARQCLLFYLEGDTSKGGKPRPPRRGLIKSLIQQPVTFCPISITYESALNDTGTKQRAFQVQDVIAAVTERQIGNIYVTFGECIDGDCAPTHQLVTQRLAAAIYSEIPILTVDLVATLLLDRGYSVTELTREVEWLTAECKARELPVICKPVEQALQSLSHLLSVDGRAITVTDRVSLNFYRNRALHAFYDLAHAPLLLRYECNWSPLAPALNGGSAKLRGLAARAVNPLINIYGRLLQVINRGAVKKAELQRLALNDEATTSCTVDNLLLALKDDGLVTVDESGLVRLVAR